MLFLVVPYHLTLERNLQLRCMSSLRAFPSCRKNRKETHILHDSNVTTPSASTFDRPNRLKGRDEGIIRWNELLEKFRMVQERARRLNRVGGDADDASSLGFSDLRVGDGTNEPKNGREVLVSARGPPVPIKDPPAPTQPTPKPRSGLGRQFGRLGGAVAGRGKKAQQ